MARQWQTVLVSVVIHAVGMFFLIVIPLLAFDGLPSLQSAVQYVPVEIKTPDLPPAPRPATPAPATSAPIASTPLEAPPVLTPEVPRPVAPSISAPGLTGAEFPSGAFTPASTPTGIVVPPPAPQAPVRPGGNVKEPQRILYVRPDYPQTAIAARIAGSVIIEAVIGTDGRVRDAKVLRSVPLLDDAALAAVKQWRYTPTLLNGVPVAVIMTVTVTFTLQHP